MNPDLKAGDRVRIRRASLSYQVGDKGTVLEGPENYFEDGQGSYIVVMDKDGPDHTPVIFGDEEIEPDT